MEPKRNRLTPKNASMLAFLYFNLPAFTYEYEWPKTVEKSDKIAVVDYVDTEDDC